MIRPLINRALGLAGLRIIRIDEPALSTEDVANLRLQLQARNQTLSRLNNVVSRFAYGEESSEESRELMKKILNAWRDAQEISQ